MLTALIAGERDPKTLAQLAHGVMRRKIPQLQQALSGRFEAHHAFLTAAMLRRIDALAADIAELDAKIDQLIAPSAAAAERLDEITGVGVRSAQKILAEIGVSTTAFPTPGHLVSWAKFAPIDQQSAGRKKTAATDKGNPWLDATLGETVAALSRTNTFLGDRYRRLARRRGKRDARSSPSATPCSPSSGTCSPTPTPTTTTSTPTTSRRSTNSGGNATSSANSNTSPARRSPLPPPPDHPSPSPAHPAPPDRRPSWPARDSWISSQPTSVRLPDCSLR
jgi:hypothetical protein